MVNGKVVALRSERPTWQEAMQDYLWYQKARGLRPATVKGQEDVIRLFFTRHDNAWDNTKEAFYRFMTEDIKPATYNIRLSYLKSFFNWCIGQGYLSENPCQGLKKRKAEDRIVNIDHEVLAELIKLPNLSTYAGLRDYALILLQLDTGIRPMEAFGLLQEDIDLKKLEITVRGVVSKTKTKRTLPISPATATATKDLINTRHPGWKDSVPVFCSAEGKPLTRHTWGDRLEIYSKQLKTKITPYSLRHSFALNFLRSGGHALALQRMMGHTDLSMTKRYVALTEADLKEQHNLASPLNSLLPQKQRVRKARK